MSAVQIQKAWCTHSLMWQTRETPTERKYGDQFGHCLFAGVRYLTKQMLLHPVNCQGSNRGTRTNRTWTILYDRQMKYKSPVFWKRGSWVLLPLKS